MAKGKVLETKQSMIFASSRIETIKTGVFTFRETYRESKNHDEDARTSFQRYSARASDCNLLGMLSPID